MRVLQVNKLYHPWRGGIEQVVQDISEGLQGRGWTVDVLTCVPHGPGREDRVNGVRVFRSSSVGVYLSMPLSIDLISRFHRLQGAYDVILLHHPFPLGFLAHWLTRPVTPTVVWYHADITRQRITGAAFRPVLNLVLRRSARVCVSSQHLSTHSEILRPFRDRCAVVPFGVPPEKFERTRVIEQEAADLRARFGSPLLLAVGRLVPYKGYDVLLAAMERVAASLIIVGDGPLRDTLLRTVCQRRLGDRVFFVGAVPSTVPYFHACDALVLPSVSKAEAFGIVQVEAMLCGKPVVNTALSTAVPEISLDGVTGLTVPPGDAEALAAALQRLVADPELRSRLGTQARSRAVSQFSLDAFLNGASAVLEDAASSRNPGTP